MQRRTAAVCGIGALAVAGILLWQPIHNPLFVKLSLNMVGERPAEAEGRSCDSCSKRRLDSGFLAPGVSWSEVVSEVGRRLPEPRADGAALDPFDDISELVEAVLAGEGVCNNWTEAIIALCRDAGRSCREWAHIPYPVEPASGHAVVELWLPETGRWAMLDAYLGFWARGPDGYPMSASEFSDAMLARSPDVDLEPIADRRLRLRDIDAYYRNERAALVEVVLNDPESLSGSWTRSIERVNKPLGQLTQWALGLSPRLLVPDDERHRELRDHMQSFRRRLAAGTGLSLLGIATLAWALLGPSSRQQHRRVGRLARGGR